MSRRQDRRDRRHHRYDVDGLKGTLQFSANVRIVNISAGGMQVETTSHLNVGRRYTFKLCRDTDSVRIGGAVAWCVLKGGEKLADGEVAPSFVAGIAFDETLTGLGRELVEFIDQSVVIDVQRRLFGRFAVDGDATAVADVDHEFEVVRLSLSGMLIRTDFAPALESSFPVQIEVGDGVLRAGGRVAYVEPKGEGEPVDVGVEFVDLEDVDRAMLRDYIESELTQEDPLVVGEKDGGGSDEV